MKYFQAEENNELECVVNDIQVLTEKALLYADQNNINAVEKLIIKRRAMLEDVEQLLPLHRDVKNMKPFFKLIQRKDKELHEKLSFYYKKTGQILKNIESSKKLRSRFSGEKQYQSRFIDRKV